MLRKSDRENPTPPESGTIERFPEFDAPVEEPSSDGLIEERTSSDKQASPDTDSAVPDSSVSFGGLDLYYNTVSDIGLIRKRNEDSCGVFIPPDSAVLDSMGVLAVLADGMGGHQSGDRASGIVLESMGRSYYEAWNDDPGDTLVRAAHSAHDAILADAAISMHDMGSTCSALLFRDRAAFAAHAGDSRIYLFRNAILEQLSADDSMVAEMVRRGIVTPEHARTHPDRSVLMNALGQRTAVTVSRASTPCELQDGDEFLICSDGLHGLLEDSEIAETLGGSPTLATANERLLCKALDRGGPDNISMILIRVRYREMQAETGSGEAKTVPGAVTP